MFEKNALTHSLADRWETKISSRRPAPAAIANFVAGLMLLAGLAAVGCGEAANVAKPKPTEEELRQLHAKFEPEPIVDAPPAVAVTPIVPVFRPWGIKETAVDSLGRIGAGAVPTLIAALSDPDPRIRAQSARALARMGSLGKDAIPALIARLEDPDDEARQAAARALGQMGPDATAAVPALVAIIESPSGRAENSAPAAVRRDTRP